MSAEMSKPAVDMVNIEVDGVPMQAPKGSMIIEATDKAGIQIPRFCYHKKLTIAANCRMCLVDVEKAPKPMPACATPVMEGMKVYTDSRRAVGFPSDGSSRHGVSPGWCSGPLGRALGHQYLGRGAGSNNQFSNVALDPQLLRAAIGQPATSSGPQVDAVQVIIEAVPALPSHAARSVNSVQMGDLWPHSRICRPICQENDLVRIPVRHETCGLEDSFSLDGTQREPIVYR